MTTYARRQISLRVSGRINGEGEFVYRGERVTKFDAIDALNECESKKYVIPIPTVDKDLLQGTTIALGKILYIESDKEITVKLAATSDTGFKVKPIVTNEATDKPGVLYMEGEFTHVYVSVAGISGEANIFMAAVGA